jgi:hypothetical protein
MNNIKSKIEVSIKLYKKALSDWFYRKRIKKLIKEVDKHPLQFNCTAQESKSYHNNKI